MYIYLSAIWRFDLNEYFILLPLQYKTGCLLLKKKILALIAILNFINILRVDLNATGLNTCSQPLLASILRRVRAPSMMECLHV